MNKDLDERLVQNGEYRDAMNIQVRTTDSNNSGTIQNIKGNRLVDSGNPAFNASYNSGLQALGENSDARCVGSIIDEKNNDAYFFIAGPDKGDLGDPSLGTQIQQIGQYLTANNEIILQDTIVRISAGNTGGSSSVRSICVDRHCIYSHIDNTLSEYIDTGIGETEYNWNSANNLDFVANGDWIAFRVNSDIAAQLRPGMEVKAYTAAGNDLFDDAVIQDVAGDKIVLYNQQDYDGSSDNIMFFRFEAPRVLNFDNRKYITGINIIDDLLIWTDGVSEPKKINIGRSTSGTALSGTRHTDLQLTSDSGFTQDVDSVLNPMSPIVAGGALAEEHVTVIRRSPVSPPTLEMSITDRSGVTDLEVSDFEFTNAGIVVDFSDEIVISGNNIDFSSTDFRPDDVLTFTQVDPDISIEDLIILKAKFITYIDSNGDDTLTPDDSIRVEMITVDTNLAPEPLDWEVELEMEKPLFETKFGRFGYRYLYEDGEYSAFSPWSELAFLPGEFDYLPKKGYNLGMENQIRELVVRDFIPLNSDRPTDVIGVDVLFKATDSANVYTVKSIRRGRDAEWENFTPNEPLETLPGTGELTITSENIHRVLPSNQILRSWDNVPRYALAQEITANRLCFGNYIQGYNILDQVNMITTIKSYDHADVDKPQPSIKTIRDYKLGMVFVDKYGRETPVIESGFSTGGLFTDAEEGTASTGDITVEKRLARFKNKFKVQHNWGLTAEASPPDWAEFVKYYVKETSSEYYNLIQGKWYHAEDGNVWLAFNSADRNKLDEETYIILKNQNGSDVPVEEKARYKILAIENEAPDYIKIDRRYMGSVQLDTGDENIQPGVEWTSSGIINTSTQVPDKLMNATFVKIPSGDWDGLIHHTLMGESRGTLKMRVYGATLDSNEAIVNIVPTQWVTVSNLKTRKENMLDEDTTIFWNEAFGNELNMLQRFTDLGYSVVDLSDYGRLSYHIEFMEEVIENKPEFDGKFFAKIETDITIEEHIMLMTPASTEYRFYIITSTKSSSTRSIFSSKYLC